MTAVTIPGRYAAEAKSRDNTARMHSGNGNGQSGE
jgi:hypothetical protein